MPVDEIEDIQAFIKKGQRDLYHCNNGSKE
jgi:hypothetical protein